MSHNESNIPDSTTRLRLLRERLAEYPVVSSSVLTDSFGRHHNYLRLSLTERCNLRCTYCMPEQGVPLQPPSHLLTTPELLRLARLFASVGTNKFRLTGGEPTLRSDLVDIVAGLNDIAVSETKSSLSSSTGRSDNGNNNILSFKRQPAIGITTNGIVLAQKLPDLVAAGLTSVNISLDTLHPETFAKLTRRPATYLSRVWDSLETAMSYASSVSSPLTVKLNCVIMRGVNDHEVADFVRLTLQYPGLHVRFIEYMPFADNGWDWSHCVPYAELIQQLNQDHNEAENDNVQLIPVVSDDPHDTTKWYQTKTAALAATTTTSRIGFITSMSQHFCSSCNRLRITADGTIKVCLFDGRNDKDSDLLFGGVFSLRDALRDGWSDLEVQKLIHQAVLTKHEALGGHSDPADIQKDAANNRPMTLIGG